MLITVPAYQFLFSTKDEVLGHPVHFVNMLSNLFDNALKYSKEDVDPVIKVSTKNEKNNIVLTVEDNGIGMSKETIARIISCNCSWLCTYRSYDQWYY